MDTGFVDEFHGVVDSFKGPLMALVAVIRVRSNIRQFIDNVFEAV
jgi:hypothetical protein